jgi:hypothetical protein
VFAGDLLLHIALDELHRRDLVVGDERVDPVDVAATDLSEHRR